MTKSFHDLFNTNKAIIGMIHLAGRDRKEKSRRALEEISLYESEGLQGIIVEDFHGSILDVEDVLEDISWKSYKVKIGVNTLRNPLLAFRLANQYRAHFVQLDSVQSLDLNLDNYDEVRGVYGDKVSVLGGVRFKYKEQTGRTLEEDIGEAQSRCEVIVTTGEGTGIETPIEKLREFRKVMGNFPLIVGAGVTAQNVAEQLRIADGAIVGSYFKGGDTRGEVDRNRVREFMDTVRGIKY